MKRSLLFGILSLAATTVTSSNVHAQGGIVIGNYQAPYNRMIWLYGPRVGQGMLSTEGVNLNIWFGEGVLTADQLTLNVPVAWNLVAEANGYAGYYGPISVILPGWSPGETWSFQVRVSGNSVFGPIDPFFYRTVVWEESTQINFIGGTPPGPPGVSTNSIGIPEPSAFALMGLGLSGWTLLRRRTPK